MDDPGEGMPMVDVFTAYWRQEEFRADPAVRLDEPQMPMRLALMFTPLDETLPRSPLGGTDFPWTFFGGRPSQPSGDELSWPRRWNGVPLSHVLQVDLYAQWLDHGRDRLEPIGLPMTGLLQFFHDLETYGDEEGDGDAWLVRWLPRDDDDAERAWTLATAPADLDVESQRPPVALAGEVSPTVPVFSEAKLSKDERARYRLLRQHLNEHPYHQNVGRRPEDFNPLTPWDEGFEPLPAPTRLGGFSAVPSNPDYDEILAEHLPIEPGDHRFLLADVNPSSSARTTGSTAVVIWRCGSGPATSPPAASIAYGPSSAPTTEVSEAEPAFGAGLGLGGRATYCPQAPPGRPCPQVREPLRRRGCGRATLVAR